jgi:hypothetical protein
MTRIPYPPPDFQMRMQDEKEWIFDPLRKKWVRLTPEEWVRQNMLQYLIRTLSYPASLIAVEREIVVGELRKRFDILVYQNTQPWMILECKEWNTPLSESVLKQALTYHIALPTPYLVISNGPDTRIYHLFGQHFTELSAFPDF